MSVNRYERGQATPTLRNLHRISEALGVEMGAISFTTNAKRALR